MGTYITEGNTWRICVGCGATDEQREAERASGVRGECSHWSTTDVCDWDECEACNNDPDLWRLGLREKPWGADDEEWDDDEDEYAEEWE